MPDQVDNTGPFCVISFPITFKSMQWNCQIVHLQPSLPSYFIQWFLHCHQRENEDLLPCLMQPGYMQKMHRFLSGSCAYSVPAGTDTLWLSFACSSHAPYIYRCDHRHYYDRVCDRMLYNPLPIEKEPSCHVLCHIRSVDDTGRSNEAQKCGSLDPWSKEVFHPTPLLLSACMRQIIHWKSFLSGIAGCPLKNKKERHNCLNFHLVLIAQGFQLIRNCEDDWW